MPDAYTAQLGLIKPEVGASRDSWGTKTNENWDDLDQFVASAMPIGGMLDFAGPNAPPGWLICDGRWVSRVTYSALFAAIGTYWGAGDGSTSFVLPNTPGRATVGPGTVIDNTGASYAFYFTQSAGWVQNTIGQANLPNITLTSSSVANHNHTGITAGGGAHAHTMDTQGAHSHGGLTHGAGDHAHTGSTDSAGSHNHSFSAIQLGGASGGGAGSYTETPRMTDASGTHTHSFTTNVAGAHQHGLNPDGLHAHTIAAAFDHTHGVWPDGGHGHTVSLGGSSTPLWVLNPVLVVTKIIYAGRQAIPATAALAVVPQRRLSTPLRGSR